MSGLTKSWFSHWMLRNMNFASQWSYYDQSIRTDNKSFIMNIVLFEMSCRFCAAIVLTWRDNWSNSKIEVLNFLHFAEVTLYSFSDRFGHILLIEIWQVEQWQRLCLNDDMLSIMVSFVNVIGIILWLDSNSACETTFVASVRMHHENS